MTTLSSPNERRAQSDHPPRLGAAVASLLKTRPITAFLALTFAIAWSIWLPVALLAPRYFLLAVLPGAWRRRSPPRCSRPLPEGSRR